jgi:hypothetical protein
MHVDHHAFKISQELILDVYICYENGNKVNITIINEVENFCAQQCWRNMVYIEERKGGRRWLCRRRVMWGTKNNIIRKLVVVE